MSLLGNVELTVTELSEIAPGVVFASITGRIKGAKSGVELEDKGAHLVDFEDGRVRRFRTFRDREQALTAAKRPG